MLRRTAAGQTTVRRVTIEREGSITLEDLARQLVERLAALLPAGVDAFSDGSFVGVTTPDGRLSALDLATGVDLVTPAVLAARAEYLLDRVQDCAIGAIGHGWPAVDSAAPGSALPVPYAEVDGPRLVLGYARGGVRAELAPIDWSSAPA